MERKKWGDDEWLGLVLIMLIVATSSLVWRLFGVEIFVLAACVFGIVAIMRKLDA